MIRFKDGKVDTGIDNVGDYVNTRQSIADALDVAVAALRELVALKDQKLLIDTQIAAANDGNYCRSVKEVRLEMDYKERKQKAWRAAREALRQIGADHAAFDFREAAARYAMMEPTMPKIELTDDDWQIISSTIPDDCIDVRIQAERGAIYRAGLAAGIERAAQRVENGRFLHDDAPTARFARECAAAIRALLGADHAD